VLKKGSRSEEVRQTVFSTYVPVPGTNVNVEASSVNDGLTLHLTGHESQCGSLRDALSNWKTIVGG
jgi:hypothetical protein